jgi:hypothetical protein
VLKIMPIQASPTVEELAAQALFDRHVLSVIRSGDAAAAQSLSTMSLGFASTQSEEEPRVFWQVGAAYFEAIALGLCPLTIDAKRTTGQILLQYRALQSGDLSGLKPVVQEMVFYCAQAEPAPGLEAPSLIAMRETFGLAKSPPPRIEEDQYKVIGDLRIGVAAFNIFLNEADEWSRHLVTELNEWSLELDRPVPDDTVVWARALSIRSGDVGFTALADFAASLLNALQYLQGIVPCDPAHARVFVQTAQDIRRLLHQFAAGFLKTPDAALLASLQALAVLDLTGAPKTPPKALKQFQEESQALMAQLGGALRQWSARPENLGARGEVLRVLSVFLASARQEDVLPLWAQADALRDVIAMLDSETLQADQMAPLLVHFESLKRAIEIFPTQST